MLTTKEAKRKKVLDRKIFGHQKVTRTELDEAFALKRKQDYVAPAPKPAASPRFCYYVSPVQDPAEHGGYVPSVVTEDEAGHSPLTGDPDKLQAPWVWGGTLAEAEQVCDLMNVEMDLSSEDVARIVASSMRA